MSSGLAPTADIDEQCRHFRDVPGGDITRARAVIKVAPDA
jgi:hypothetical protein